MIIAKRKHTGVNNIEQTKTQVITLFVEPGASKSIGDITTKGSEQTIPSPYIIDIIKGNELFFSFNFCNPYLHTFLRLFYINIYSLNCLYQPNYELG